MPIRWILRTALVWMVITLPSAVFASIDPNSPDKPAWFPDVPCSESTPIHRKSCYKKWTVLVYMAADNDLSPYAFWNLYEMESGYPEGHAQGASSARADWVVQADTAGNTGISRLSMRESPMPPNFSLQRDDFQNFSIQSLFSPVVSTVYEPGQEPENSRKNHPKLLRDFLEWGIQEYPSEYTWVILWSHGQGWNSHPANHHWKEDPFAGVPENPMKVPLSTLQLEDVLTYIKFFVLGGRNIDLYASDACLMQQSEVAFQISKLTQYIVGSAEVQSYLGFPYRAMMRELNAGTFFLNGATPSVDLSQESYHAARMIPELVEALFNGKNLGFPEFDRAKTDSFAVKQRTMAALSSQSLRYDLRPSLDQLAVALMNYLDEVSVLPGESNLRLLNLRYLLGELPSFQGKAQDLGIFLSSLSSLLREEMQSMDLEETSGRAPSPTVLALQGAIESTEKILRSTVIASSSGSQYDLNQMEGFQGLSIWLPESRQDYVDRVSQFRKSKFFKYRRAHQPIQQWGPWDQLLARIWKLDSNLLRKSR